MSKCAQNMMGKLFALDVKPRGIAMVCLHPGFMKTSMTEIYADKYDELGAIGPEEAAPGLVKVCVRPPPVESGELFMRLMGQATRKTARLCLASAQKDDNL